MPGIARRTTDRSRSQSEPGLPIRDVVAASGLSEATLRAWEARYGFPAPQRSASGHRRYAAGDVELIRQVLRDREAGLSLSAAIARARSDGAATAEPESLFAAVRARRPELAPQRLSHAAMLAISRAIEDESLASADRVILFGAFQHARFYRRSQARWRELARTAPLAAVFADFRTGRRPRGGPVEIPIDRHEPLAREWAVVACGRRWSACVAAIEIPEASGAGRRFEAIWSAEPEVAHLAALAACDLAARRAPELADEARAILGEPPAPSDARLRATNALAGRMVAYVASPPTARQVIPERSRRPRRSG